MKKYTLNIDVMNSFFIAVSSLIIVGGIFRPGILIMADHPMHFMEVFYLVNKLIPSYHWVDGWCMAPPPGHPMLLYVYQLGGWIVAMLNMLLKVDLNLAYKISMYISAAFPPIALYIFLKSRFGRPAAMSGSFLFAFQTLHINLLLTSVWNSYLAVGIFIVFFDILDRNYRNLNAKTIALLSILQAMIIVAHPIAHLVSFMLVGSFFLTALFKDIKGDKASRYRPMLILLIPVGGSLITFYYLFNLFVTRNWLVGFNAPWLDKTFTVNLLLLAKTIFGGFNNFVDTKLLNTSQYAVFFKGVLVTVFTIIPELARSLLGLLGLWFLLFKNEGRYSNFFRTISIFTFFTFFVFTGIWHYIPVIKDMPLVGTMINKRLLIYLHLVLCILAAYAVMRIAKSPTCGKLLKNRIAAYLLVLALVFAISVSECYIASVSGLFATTDNLKKMDAIKEVWRWAATNVDRNSRIVYQSTFGNDVGEPVLLRSHVTALGMYYTPCLHVVTCGTTEQFPTYKELDTSNGKFFGIPVEAISKGDIIEKMEVFNAKYIVALEPKLKNKLASISDFKIIKRIDGFDIFEYTSLLPGWAYFSGGNDSGTSNCETFDDYHIKIAGYNKLKNNEIIVKVGYHPYWSASLNGKVASVVSGPFGLMSIKLAETGRFTLDLRYNSKKAIPIAVSIVSLLVFLSIFAVNPSKNSNLL